MAAALQDHDRAWIIGESTFGKGLVQAVYSLPGRTGMALVKSKYYTPSGRLIQRKRFSALGYYHIKSTSRRHIWATDAGRPVYGGAGIEPDEHFALHCDAFQMRLKSTFAFVTFANHYFRSLKTPSEGRQPDNFAMRQFQDYL